MKNPPHPGEIIGDSLEELGVIIAAAANGLGVTRQQLYNLVAGRRAIMSEGPVGSNKRLAAIDDTTYTLVQCQNPKNGSERFVSLW